MHICNGSQRQPIISAANLQRLSAIASVVGAALLVVSTYAIFANHYPFIAMPFMASVPLQCWTYLALISFVALPILVSVLLAQRAEAKERELAIIKGVESFPKEIWLQIFGFLTHDVALVRIRQICKTFKSWHEDPTLRVQRNLFYASRISDTPDFLISYCNRYAIRVCCITSLEARAVA